MAIINKTGITNGGTIEAEHVTRAIDALSGVSTDSVVATGSFTGSFKGPLIGGADTAGAVNTLTNSSENQSYYITSVSTATGNNALYTDSNLTFNPNTNALTLTGSLSVTGSFAVNASITTTPATTVNFAGINQNGYVALPLVEPTNPIEGAIYFDSAGQRIYIYDGINWVAYNQG
jgi:hypothetical protein